MEYLEELSQWYKDQIRSILLYDWDPIGVHNIAEAQDEYDAYIFDIYTMIKENRPINDFEKYLFEIEENHMGLVPDKNKNKYIANKILSIEIKNLDE